MTKVGFIDDKGKVAFIGTLADAGDDDSSLVLSPTLNDAAAAVGAETFRGIKLNITETDITGWNAVYLMDLQIDGGTKFLLDRTGALQLGGAGASVSEFSIDGTLAGNSDIAIPTEQAVKTYVDAQVAGKDTFLELNDTPVGYTTNGALYVANNTGTTIDESTVIMTEGANTFNFTKGTASLDIAAGAALNIDANVTVSNAITIGATNGGTIDFTGAAKTLNVEDTATVDQDLTQDASVNFGDVTAIGASAIGGMNITAQAIVTTNDATVTTCGSLTLADNTLYQISAMIVGVDTTNTPADQWAGYELKGTFYRTNAGGATQLGATTSAHTSETDAAWDATFDVNGNDVRIRVTGEAAKNVNWKSVITHINVGE